MALAGLLEWSNSIRFNMATDPGRQLFQDQINTHGFLFLDGYLDNILSGAKQDPLIELVKTPGRKKAILKQPKPTSKLNSVTSSLLDEDNDKENVAPINNFHKTLLEAKDKSPHPTPPAPLQSYNSQQATTPHELPGRATDGMQVASSANHISTELPKILPPAQADELLAPHTDQNHLSAIAEDDENPEQSDRSRFSLQVSHNGDDVQLSASFKENMGRIDMPSSIHDTFYQEVPQTMNVTNSSSDSFHSITLDSPPSKQVSKMPARSLSPLRASLESKSSGHLESKHKLIESNVSAPLPSSNPPVLPHSITPTTSESLVQDLTAPLCDDGLALSSPKSVDHKPSVSLYPALPAPMPLRKSMRAPRDPSVGAGPLGTTTPGAPLGGKRTSWLKKAREVKALEGTNRTIAPGLPAGISQPQMPFLINPLKRKSADITAVPTATGLEDEERQYKSAKNAVGDIAPLQPQITTAKVMEKEEQHIPAQMSQVQLHGEHEGMLDRLKKTVEGLGARVGKSMGKSLGAGTSGSALAEARAAAEARVAQRNNKDEEFTRVMAPIPITTPEAIPQPVEASSSPMDDRKTPNLPVLPMSSTWEAERRLSISDLFPPNNDVTKIKSKESRKILQITPPDSQPTFSKQSSIRRESGTTTPPDSPPATQPASFLLPSGPVFNKPPPVFVPPAPASKSALPATQNCVVPASATTVSVAVTVQPASLTAHPTTESMKSDRMFDDDDDVPAWMPATQDTEHFGSQDGIGHANVLDEDDDSWPLDEKLASGVPWTFGGGMSKEDSMTWSTVPSQSQRLDTVHSQKDQMLSIREHDSELPQASKVIPGAFDVEMDNDEHEVSEMIVNDDVDLEEMMMEGTSTVSLVPTAVRSQSQASMASSASSQSQAGFFGQASKLLSSALGTSKKGKPEVKKVLQKAAVAAKKQQEENDKKATRLKDMENRRQLAIQRKAEEEKARTQEEERKLKEEGERRKREREENTDKRPLKMIPSKDDEATKKRKVTVEVEKPELKKPASKSILRSAMKQQTAAYNTSLQTTATINAMTIPKSSEAKPSKPSTAAVQKGKGKAPPNIAPPVDDEVTQPSQLVHAQMAARAKAQIQAAKRATGPVVQSESIELPDINSEYSDSEDEDRARTFDPPHWAQSPELRHALQAQSTINPDEIFGAVRPLRMEELFKTRSTKFRARTSSANWTGADRLTVEEEREYARRMGFK